MRLIPTLILSAALLVGCKKAITESLSPTKGHQTITDTANGLKTTTGVIKDSVTRGQAATPDGVKPKLLPFWLAISDAASKQEVYIVSLNSSAKDYKEMADWGVSWQQRAQKAEASISQEVRHQFAIYSGWLFFLAILSGIAAIFSKSKLVGYASALCLLGSLVAVTLVQSIPLVPWIIGGIALVTAICLTVSFVQHRTNNAIQANAAAASPVGDNSQMQTAA